jgi:predicted component of type VI protein secretion system
MDVKKTKSNNKHKVIKELVEIFDMFPETEISSHLITLLRPGNKAFYWSDEELHSKILRYKRELTELKIEKYIK